MIAAWRAFIAAKAFGHYDTSTHAKRLYEAGWPTDVRPYNAKHTVGILLAQGGADYEDIRDFFGHRDVKTTRIYTGFVASRLRKTSGLLAGRLGWHTRKQA
jgi:site-specific recombinase XerD